MAFVNGVASIITITDPETEQAFAFAAGSSANRVMKSWIVWNDSGGHSLTTVSYGGTSLTTNGVPVDIGNIRMCSYRLVAPSSSTNTFSVNWDAAGFGGPLNAFACVGVWDSIDQTTPLDNYGSATGTDASAEITQTSATGDTPVFCCAWTATAPSSISETNYTQQGEAVIGSYIANFGDGTGAASVAFTGTLSSVAPIGWVAMGANLNVASGDTSATAVTYAMPLIGSGGLIGPRRYLIG
jgi:hypothetical protein